MSYDVNNVIKCQLIMMHICPTIYICWSSQNRTHKGHIWTMYLSKQISLQHILLYLDKTILLCFLLSYLAKTIFLQLFNSSLSFLFFSQDHFHSTFDFFVSLLFYSWNHFPLDIYHQWFIKKAYNNSIIIMFMDIEYVRCPYVSYISAIETE